MNETLPVRVFERCPPACWERTRRAGRTDRWRKVCDHIPVGPQEFQVRIEPPANQVDWEAWMKEYEAVETARKETSNG